METFRRLDHFSAQTPAAIGRLLSEIDYKFSARPGGQFKSVPIEIEETLPDGTKRIRFQTGHDYHPLLLTGAFVFDFLGIHAFADGNGRMSRLLTLLLLYQAGYEVGRFISLERLIQDSNETYYDALEASTKGWHEGEHDLEPWTRYFLGIMVAAYAALEQRARTVASAKGAKRELIHDFIRSRISDRFTVGDVRAAVPLARDNYVGQVLRELAREGAIELMGRGRNAEWRRIRSDF